MFEYILQLKLKQLQYPYVTDTWDTEKRQNSTITSVALGMYKYRIHKHIKLYFLKILSKN